MRPIRLLAAAGFTAAGLGGVGLVPATGTASAGAAQVSNDPGLGRQWGLSRIHAEAAWDVARGAGITIAVIDSGVSPAHPDLEAKLEGGAAGLVDCVGHNTEPSGCVVGSGDDDAGHGTHVAGIAAASTGNGIGVAGVAPEATLLSIKALHNVCNSEGDCEATGNTDDVAQAVLWAADHGAEIINLSLGSATQQVLGPAFSDALQYAWARGVIPVLAAGNAPLPIGSVFDLRAVLVAATTRDDTQAEYSGSIGNTQWAVAAPGGEADDAASCSSAAPNGVLSTWVTVPVGGPPEPGYACVAGTSMAAPHVAGALALLRSRGYSPQESIDRLLSTAQDLGSPGRDPVFGSGRIDVAAALGVQASGGTGVPTDPGTAPPASPTTLPGAAATIPGAVTVPPPTAPPSDTTVPSSGPAQVDPTPLDDDLAGGIARPGSSEDPLPALPLTVAVLAVIATFGAHGWRYLSGASWARRTPDR